MRSLILATVLCLPIVVQRTGAERHITVGRSHFCYIADSDFAAACAGDGWSTDTPGPFHGVSAGNGFTCGLSMSNHTASCWGTGNSTNPLPLPSWLLELDPRTEFLDISAGENHLCGLQPNGVISCYGGTRNVPAGGPGYTSVSAGNGIACGVTRAPPDGSSEGGSIVCWADSSSNALLSGIPRGSFCDVSVGDSHACALAHNGSLACWGDVSGYSGLDLTRDYIFLSAGGNHTCGVTSDYEVLCNRLTLQPSGSEKTTREVAAGGAGVASIAGGGPNRQFAAFNTTFCAYTPAISRAEFARRWSSVAMSANGLFVVAASSDGALLTSIDGGVEWTPRETIRGWSALASSADGMRLLAGVSNGQLYTSTDGGVSWAPRESARTWAAVGSSADGLRLVAAASNGTLYTSADGGLSWAPRETSRSWAAVASSSDGLRLLAAVANGQLYTSTDGGSTWIPRETARAWVSVASSADGTRLSAAVAGGQLYTSVDGGGFWTPRETNRAWSGLASSADGMRLVAAVSGSLLYFSVDGGVSWAPRESNRAWAAVASSADGTRLVAGVSGGPLYASSDRGLTFSSYRYPAFGPSPLFGDLRPSEVGLAWYAVASSSDGMRLLAAVNGGALYTSTDGGASWGIAGNAPTLFWVSVASSTDGMRLTAAPLGGAIYGSTDGGISWAVRQSAPISWSGVASSADGARVIGAPAGGQLYIGVDSFWVLRESARSWAAVASSSDGTRLVAAVSSGQLYTSADGGNNWTPRETSRNWQALASSADGLRLLAAANGGQLYSSVDGGVTWTPRESARSWRAVASSNDGIRLIAAVAGGQLYTSTDGGITWTPRESARSWRAVASSADGMRLVAAVDGGRLYTSADRGVTWASVENSVVVWSAVASSADGSRLAVAHTGQLYTSNDSGLTWTPREVPRSWRALASSSDGVRLIGGVSGGPLYTSVDAGVTWTARESARSWRAVASSADGMRLLAAVSPGQLFTSVDRGVSWTPRESVRTWVSVGSSSDGLRLVAAASFDRLYTSGDGGVSWISRDSVRAWVAVVSSADGIRLCAAVSNGQLYTSVDAGISWVPRESSRAWSAVASSADGMRLVASVSNGQLYTSLDGGISWTPRESSRAWTALALSADGARLVAGVGNGRILSSGSVPCSLRASTTAASLSTASRPLLGANESIVTPRHVSLNSGQELYTARMTPSTTALAAALPIWGWPRSMASFVLEAPDAIPPAYFRLGGTAVGRLSSLLLTAQTKKARVISPLRELSGLSILSCRGVGLHSVRPSVLSFDVLPPSRLAVLDLADNGLSALLVSAPTLRLAPGAIVDLSSNAFNETEGFLPALKRLASQSSDVRLLTLADNKLRVVPARAFSQGFESVAALDLRNNGITSLSDTAFDDVGNGNLADLSLSGNSLGAVCQAGDYNRQASFRNRLETSFSYAGCALCPAGSFCPGDGRASQCQAGTYSNAEGASSNMTCLPCPAGTYTELRGQSRIGCVSCSPGFASAVVGSASVSTCVQCTPGFFASNPGQVKCTACPRGTWSSAVGADELATCVACPLGRWSNTLAAVNASTCIPCDEGSVTLEPGATSSSSCIRPQCPSGTFALANGTCRACAAGFSAASGSTSCLECPFGFYAPLPQTASCTPCAAGFYGLSKAQTSAASACAPCPPGTVNTLDGQTRVGCAACAPGTASAVWNASTAESCKQCLPGYFAAVPGQSECTPCPAGTWLSAVGAGSSTACIACPRGRFSSVLAAVNSTTCIPCDEGSLTLEPGATSSSSCVKPQCPAGTSALLNGTCLPCAAGFYANAGSTSCSACPVGFFAPQPQTSSCTPCAVGFFGLRKAQTSSAVACVPCPRGTVNTLDGQTRVGCAACAPGSASPTLNASSEDSCKLCTPGFYASVPGQAECSACPAGTYTSDIGASVASACRGCPRGRWSSASAATSSATCVPCAPGYTSATDSADSVDACSIDVRRACAPGFGFSLAAGGCALCQPGFTGTPGELGCAPCPAGRYQLPNTQGAADTCVQCPVGRYSGSLNATSANVCIACPFGYSPSEAASGCVGCPTGRVAVVASTAPGFTCEACSGGANSTAMCTSGVTVALPRPTVVSAQLGSLSDTLRSLLPPRSRRVLQATAGAPQAVPLSSNALQLPSSSSSAASQARLAAPPPQHSTLSPDLAAFVLSPYALAVATSAAAMLPVLFFVLPAVRSLLSSSLARAADMFAKERPLEDGDTVQQFTSPLGVGVTIAYLFGMIGAATVLGLAWRADNAVYASSLRPLLADFKWSQLTAPLDLTLGLAADVGVGCGSITLAQGSQDVSTGATATAYTLQMPSAAETEASGSRLPTLCAVRLAWPSLDGSASSLLLNASLRLPPSAQSLAWQVNGLLTPSFDKVNVAPTSALASGTSEPPPQSLGLAGLRLHLTLMPMMEEDDLLPRTTYGALLVGAAVSAQPRETDEIVPDKDAVIVLLTAEPAQQYLHVSVTQRTSIAQLLASAVGLLSGLSVFFRMAYTWLYGCVKTMNGGPPDWELRALADKRERDRVAALGFRRPSRLGSMLTMARGSLFVKPRGGASGMKAASLSPKMTAPITPSAAPAPIVTSDFQGTVVVSVTPKGFAATRRKSLSSVRTLVSHEPTSTSPSTAPAAEVVLHSNPLVRVASLDPHVAVSSSSSTKPGSL